MRPSTVVYLAHQAAERLGYNSFEMFAITRAKLLRKRRAGCVDYFRESDLEEFECRRANDAGFGVEINFSIITLSLDLPYVNN